MTFVGAAVAAGSLTMAPRAFAYWKMKNAYTCVPYSSGYGYRGVREGDLSTDFIGISNTSDQTIWLECEDGHDSNSYPDGHATIVRAKFNRWYAASPVPRVHFCSNWYGCGPYFYGASTVGDINIDANPGVWRPGRTNTMEVPLDPTYQDWGRVMRFYNYTVGTELSPWQ